MTNKISKRIIVSHTEAHQRVDRFLASHLPEFSRMLIKAWIEEHAVTINKIIIKPKTFVKENDVVEINAHLPNYATWEAESLPMNIAYEDQALILINKPAGLIVHPGAGNPNHTLVNALLHYDKALQHLPRAGILHRLDKDTTGLLVVAKTSAALTALSNQLKQKTLLRAYQAIVIGNLISGGTINQPIARNPFVRTKMAVVPDGKKAVTHYRILNKFRAHTHLDLKLETGRTHQIRVHLSFINHPIVGDKQYGKLLFSHKNMSEHTINFLKNFNRQALHAYKIGFIHPLTTKWWEFEIPLPEDMNKLITVLTYEQ